MFLRVSSPLKLKKTSYLNLFWLDELEVEAIIFGADELEEDAIE